MATTRIHILLALIAGHSLSDALLLTTPDSVRCWSGARQLTHFTINPKTGQVSWIEFPDMPVWEWSKSIISDCPKFDAGKPGNAAVDENTILEEFWRHNKKTPQNQLFYEHLVQDRFYDMYLRKYVDVSRRYEDIYRFEDKEYSGEEFRKKGDNRWNGESLVNSFDSQLFMVLAKILYREQNITANREWFEKEVFPVYYQVYSKELAANTIRFISMSDRADELISKHAFYCDKAFMSPVPLDEVETFVATLRFWL